MGKDATCAGLIGLGGLHGEQLARLGDALGAIAVGEQAVVADAKKAFRQHVHEETPDELADFERHRLPAARTVDAIVLPSERDAQLPDDIATLKAMVIAAEKKASDRGLEIEALKLTIAKLQRSTFGASSESGKKLLDQLELSRRPFAPSPFRRRVEANGFSGFLPWRIAWRRLSSNN